MLSPILPVVTGITRFILVQTLQNENVGAAARAIKTMGFHDLCLVEPNDPNVLRRSKTIRRASGAMDVLEQCTIYQTVEDALQGCHIKCATGMPTSMGLPRSEQYYQEPRQFFPQQLLLESNRPIHMAFVFGNEKYGLQEHHLDACNVVLGIPTNPAFGSLNLAAAVQIIAYDWRQALGGFE